MIEIPYWAVAVLLLTMLAGTGIITTLLGILFRREADEPIGTIVILFVELFAAVVIGVSMLQEILKPFDIVIT